MNKDNSNKYTYQLSDLERRITLARGEEMVDLIIKNTRIINVFSGEIHETDVAIADGIFIGLGNGYDAKYSYDAQGRYMCPGLIDGHIHIESTFLSPSEFCNVVAAHGTSAVICDLHEIANVLGPIGLDYFIMSLVSDDRSPTDLKENGHIDYLIRSAISLGLTPIRAIQMGSINTARYFGLKNLGAIAPGFKADFILLDDLKSFKISQIFLAGRRIENIGPNRTSTSNVNDKNFLLDFSFLRNTVHIKSLDNQNMFAIHTSSNDLSSTLMQVIGVIPGQIITHKRTLSARVNDQCEAIADGSRDLAKLAVIERHHRTGNIGLGFVQGLGLERGAIASSVAHDSHNLVVAGMDDLDMLIAARDISSIGGGLSVALDKQVIANFPLPIAGLMSDAKIDSVITSLEALNTACLKLGVKVVKDPFMLLSFLALPVIPSLKLTDKGLVDVDNFRYTSLWLD